MNSPSTGVLGLTRSQWGVGVFLALLCVIGLLAWSLRIPPYAIDYGEWRVVVIQSDDWGLEGWYPDQRVADRLSELGNGLAPGMEPYQTSSLASLEDLDALRKLLMEYCDTDGLPAILQANWVAAAVDVEAQAPAVSGLVWELREAAKTGRWARPGFHEMIDELEAEGVLRAELHGLSHHDLRAYSRARNSGEPLASRAASEGLVGYEGWLRAHEFGHGDSLHAARISREAVRRFRQRFGRSPTSMIAPDYVWDSIDEGIWWGEGIAVVQAKEEQRNPSRPTRTILERIQKRWALVSAMRKGPMLHLFRPAKLEPYGNPDPKVLQGAGAAASAVRAAWAAGRPGIISIHRVQLANLDPSISQAGRAQLRALLKDLGPTRILVDSEIEQLERRGWSRLQRGGVEVWRNYGEAEVGVEDGGRRRVLPRGTLIDPLGTP